MMTANSENRKEQEQRSERHSRIRFTKRLLRPLPRKGNLHRWPIIKWFAKSARKQPHLWSFRVAQVSPSIYVGCILAFMPAYGIQLVLAFLAALLFRSNVIVITALQFITNPITAVPIYLFTLKFGEKLIGWGNLGEFHNVVGAKAYAFFIGGLTAGLATAVVLDVIYRIAAARAAKRQQSLKRILKS